MPVLVACALAWADGVFSWVPAVLALGFGLLLQVVTNYANDYYDFRRGADTPERRGPTRVTASGLVSPTAMRKATLLLLLLAFAVGFPLVFFGGWWLLPVGVVFLVLAFAYTGGPFPLAYHGLGEVFVFVFFGPVATAFTYYVQAGEFTLAAALPGVGLGALATNLLQINNLRDRETDAAANKNTLVVRFGRGFGHTLIFLMVLVAIAVPVFLQRLGYPWLVVLPVILAPMMGRLWGAGRRTEDPDELNPLLPKWAGVLLLYGLLLALGLVAGPWADRFG